MGVAEIVKSRHMHARQHEPKTHVIGFCPRVLPVHEVARALHEHNLVRVERELALERVLDLDLVAVRRILAEFGPAAITRELVYPPSPRPNRIDGNSGLAH
jgi:hypothetical protein